MRQRKYDIRDIVALTYWYYVPEYWIIIGIVLLILAVMIFL